MRNAVHYRPSKNVAREESLEPALKPTHTIAREFLYPGEEEAVWSALHPNQALQSRTRNYQNKYH